jgi:hypothetical protein
VDGNGNLYVGDYQNLAVKEIDFSDPPSLTFPNTTIGSQSAAQSVTVQNIGNATLSAVAPGLTVGANFTQVAGSGTPADCSATFSLSPGESCNISINFSPAGIGLLQSTATLTDNALNITPSASQVIELSGTGQAGMPASITANPLSTPQTATVGAQFANQLVLADQHSRSTRFHHHKRRHDTAIGYYQHGLHPARRNGERQFR